MPSLSFAAPTSVDEAVKMLAGASGTAKVLAGGTDLLVQLRSGRMKPDLIVDTKRIPGMIGIREEANQFVIGASTPGAVVYEHKALTQAWPGIVEGLDLIGSEQIQGRASLAGNLCNASPAADSVPALIAARATAVIAGPGGRRRRGHRCLEHDRHAGLHRYPSAYVGRDFAQYWGRLPAGGE